MFLQMSVTIKKKDWCNHRPSVVSGNKKLSAAIYNWDKEKLSFLNWTWPVTLHYANRRDKSSSDTENRTIYRNRISKGSVSSMWLIVAQRSRVSDCSKLQIKGPFILSHKCSWRAGWCLRRYVRCRVGVGCVYVFVCVSVCVGDCFFFFHRVRWEENCRK